LVSNFNDQKIYKNVFGGDDDIAASKTECKYCKMYGDIVSYIKSVVIQDDIKVQNTAII